MAKQDGSIQTLSKAATVLDLLAARGELTVAEISEATSEPRSSVYRLLASLEDLELVESGSRRGTHRLGLALVRLGAAVVERFDEREAALQPMEELHAATGETVFLCIRRANEAVCIARLDGKRVRSLALTLGGSLPLHAGAASRVLLAFEPQEVWDEYVAGSDLAALTEHTPTKKRELFALLEETRARGYAISDEDVTPGIAAVGAPLLGYDGRIRGALSISGTQPAILGDADATVELVLAAASKSSRALGFTG
jgi:DNA-binding IclR family transcriptional regulator